MKLLEIFSKTIFRIFAGRSLHKLRIYSIENVLSRSVQLLEQQSLDEIKKYIKSQQTVEGGFANKGGKCDLYYSLFGCYIAEALGIIEVKHSLRAYVKKIILEGELSGVHQKCAVILYVKLFGSETLPEFLRKNEPLAAQYSDFINLLAYYYSEDYASLSMVWQKLRKIRISSEMPCSVTSANMILQDCFNITDKEPWEQMKGFYRNGSFSAYNKTAHGDLLSTGVALYALRFVNSELDFIKPDCLMYIDSLYSEGGFTATKMDSGTDVEYTFYGLLALGSLAD
jgi:hypothetical protein